MSALRVAAASVVVAAMGSAGAAATPNVDRPWLTFGSAYVGPFLGVCATDLQGHTFRVSDPGWAESPSWSPDGRSLAFMSGGPVIVDPNGRVLHSWQGRSNSSFRGLWWSPDGRELAVVGTWGASSWLSIIEANGERGRTLVESVSHDAVPSWSPDGTRVLFSKSASTYVIDSNGANERKLIDSAAEAVWSPDGRQIAYDELGPDGTHVGLAVARSDGGDPHQLAQGDVWAPAWSPDGATIAFSRKAGRSFEIVLVNAEGTNEHTIATGLFPSTYTPGFVEAPVWSPDGDWIAFMRGPDPIRIAVIRPDGTDERTIAAGVLGAWAYSPSWRRASQLPSHRRACVVRGTARADVLRGTVRGDVIDGGAGNDRIYGGGGNDVLVGGRGHDRLYGGAGNDVFESKDGMRDKLFGGPGSDFAVYDVSLDRRVSIP